MISRKMLTTFNQQLNMELYSAHLYLSMSSYANYIGLKGAANWFMVQHQEEMLHFMKFYGYVNSQGEHVQLGPLQAIPAEFASFLDLFEKTLAHEQIITRSINDLMEVAVKEKDHATQIFLQWFVTEQIEEEENDREVIAKLKLIGDNGQGLLMLDNELAARVFVAPPTMAA